MKTICGIDEAGRGPLIGPLVLCGVVIHEGEEQTLLDWGVKDSKLLTPKQREKLADILKQKYSYHLVEVPSTEIDAAVQGTTTNLNWLEADKAAEIINTLNPDHVILDCPSPNIKAYTNYILDKLTNKKTVLHCAHHADRDFPVVGAASILAKVTRDARIAELKKKIGIDFGSGYTADPTTAAFLQKYWNKYPELFRHSWAPYQKLVQQKKQTALGRY